MRSLLGAAAALLLMLKPALAAKSPVPVSFGYNKALNFTLDENNDMISGLATDMETIPHHPHVNLIGGGGALHTPPVFNHQGSCCRPTAQCHAYFKWVIDMINPTPQWDSDDQRSEAMAHLDCCMRQYRASCANPPKGHTVIWRDPARLCSNGPDHVEYEGDGVGKDRLEDAIDALPGPVDLDGTDGLELPKVEENVKVEEEEKGDGELKANYEVKVDEAPVDEAPVDDAPVDDAPVDDAPVDEAPIDDAPLDEAPIDEAKADEAKIDEGEAGEAKVDDAAKVDEAGEQS